jgi:hypothetical protein
MKHIWIYEEYKDPKLQKEILKFLPEKFLAERVVKMIGLFDFIKESNIKSVKELQEKVRKDGNPLFNDKQASKIIKKVGGGEAYNALVQRGLDYAYLLTPETIRGILDIVRKFIFPLSEVPVTDPETGRKHPEGWIARIPITGQAVSMVLTMVTEFNKTAAKLAQQYTPMIVGLVPIPFSSPIGTAIGYMISALFIFFNLIIFTAQHNFGDVYIQSLALIPFVGLAFQNYAESSDRFIEKFAEKRQELIEQLRGKEIINENGEKSYDGKLSFVGNLIDKFTFDPLKSVSNEEMEAHIKELKSKVKSTADNLQKTALKVKNDAMAYTNPENRSKLQAEYSAKLDSVKNIVYQNSKKIQDKAKEYYDKTPEQLQKLKSKLELNLETAKKLYEDSKKSDNLEKVKKAEQQLQKVVIEEKAVEEAQTKPSGGKRFSSRKHYKSKWKTQRKKLKRRSKNGSH